MIEAVLTFGLITAIGEIILLTSLPKVVRRTIVHSKILSNLVHLSFAALNLIIHWGTITGSMTAVVAFVTSSVVLAGFRTIDKVRTT